MPRHLGRAQLAAANEAGDGLLATRVAVALTKVLEAMAKITGEVSSLAGSINVTNDIVLTDHPLFLKLQAAMLRALQTHPQARADVVAALRALDAENAQADSARPMAAPPVLIEAYVNG